MFELDSVQVKLDDKVVASYLYTAARGRGAAPRRRAARLARQPEDRRARARSPSSPARARTSATTGAAPTSSSRRAPRPSTSSCASRTRLASSSPSSTSSSGSELAMRQASPVRLALASTEDRRCGRGVGARRRRAAALAVRPTRPAEPNARDQGPVLRRRPVPLLPGPLLHVGDDADGVAAVRPRRRITTTRPEILRGGMLAVVRPDQGGGRDLRQADRAAPRRRCATAPGSISPRSATSAATCPRPKNALAQVEGKLPPSLQEERGPARSPTC